jgi:hypothetical protein
MILSHCTEVTRTAYQRLYEMILSYGMAKTLENNDKVSPSASAFCLS